MRETPVRIGPYEIVMELAAGGMAATYIAHKRGETFFERLVVVKRIHPWLLDDPTSGEMLREEARLGAALQHPHVVHIEDVTVAAGEVCLIMPYVESLSLGALLKLVRQKGERMPPPIVSRILLDVLSGLHAAHEAKDLRGELLDIVHRDVSPNNILVGTEGQSRIIDFGIARAKSRLCQTQSGDMKGTLAYMSPEQLRRRELDRRADIFAAGAVLYESLTGERLFDGRDEADILIGVLADDIPPVHERHGDVGSEIDAVLARALARDRDERYSTARDFAMALAAALPPASITDVATFVDRLGEVEFNRRREAVRVFVEQRRNEASSSAIHSTVLTSTKSNSIHEPARDSRGTAIVGIILATCVVFAFFGLVWAPRRDRTAMPQATSSTLSEVPRIVSSNQPPSISSAEDLPSAMPNQPPAPNASSTANSIPSAVRRLGPQHEKVDKTRASELQDNPYR
ncbi:MAG TPA: serine/threonine-protein kinase [Polyangium sp.]|nr:serine/threonine-protein kinase [Polyangium sp.]